MQQKQHIKLVPSSCCLVLLVLVSAVAATVQAEYLPFFNDMDLLQGVDRSNLYEQQELSRMRRQISTGAPPPPPQPQQPSTNLLGSLSDLGPQLEKAQSSFKMFSSLFSSGPSSNGAAPGTSQPGGAGPVQAPPTGPSALPSASQLMSQIGELVRSTQQRSAKTMADVQQGAQQATQQNVQAVQGASSGMAAALSEMVQGLQKIAMSNPSLLPEVKNLYQSVSSKLSSTASSVMPQSKEQQVADQLSKAFQTTSS